jgi:hypothetical protein
LADHLKRAILSHVWSSSAQVWLPLMDDDGMAAYPGVSALASGVTHHVFLSAHGLHQGHKWMHVTGMHRPGHDVVVPNSQYVLDPARGKRPCDFFSRDRSVKLLFQGSVNDAVPEHNSRLVAQRTLQPLLAERAARDMVFGDFTSGGGLSGMQSAVFCLALHGRNGGWAQRDLMGLLEGCLPVWALAHTSVTFDELFDPHTYGVLTNETSLAQLPDFLDRLSESTVAQLRQAAAQVCESVRPPADDDDIDADGNSFSSLWRILAARASSLPPPYKDDAPSAYHSPHRDACP